MPGPPVEHVVRHRGRRACPLPPSPQMTSRRDVSRPDGPGRWFPTMVQCRARPRSSRGRDGCPERSGRADRRAGAVLRHDPEAVARAGREPGEPDREPAGRRRSTPAATVSALRDPKVRAAPISTQTRDREAVRRRRRHGDPRARQRRSPDGARAADGRHARRCGRRRRRHASSRPSSRATSRAWYSMPGVRPAERLRDGDRRRAPSPRS